MSGRNGTRSAQTLTVSMSRSWLFLGELLSSRARLRFTNRHYLDSVGCNCKPLFHRDARAANDGATDETSFFKT
jgi:hypothetical protein